MAPAVEMANAPPVTRPINSLRFIGSPPQVF
jgi:hypothetical protein